MELLEKLAKHCRDNQAAVVIQNNGAEFLIASEWGQEAEDSPMVGAAAYGMDPDLSCALEQALTHIRL